MPIVLDASVTIAWALEDEITPAAERVFALLPVSRAIAPALWWYELRNALLVAERKGRIRPSVTASFLTEVIGLPIELDRAPDGTALLELARRYRLSAYDATYLELADRLGQPLATLDRALARAAGRHGVELIGAA